MLPVFVLPDTLRGSKPLQAEAWVTLPDRSMLFEKQADPIEFSTQNRGRGGTAIIIDEQQQMQTIDGFGYSLTGGSAELMMQMSPEKEVRSSVNSLRRMEIISVFPISALL